MLVFSRDMERKMETTISGFGSVLGYIPQKVGPPGSRCKVGV